MPGYYIYAAAGELLSLSVHCETVFSRLDDKDVYLMGRCPVCPLKIKPELVYVKYMLTECNAECVWICLFVVFCVTI